MVVDSIIIFYCSASSSCIVFWRGKGIQNYNFHNSNMWILAFGVDEVFDLETEFWVLYSIDTVSFLHIWLLNHRRVMFDIDELLAFNNNLLQHNIFVWISMLDFEAYLLDIPWSHENAKIHLGLFFLHSLRGKAYLFFSPFFEQLTFSSFNDGHCLLPFHWNIKLTWWLPSLSCKTFYHFFYLFHVLLVHRTICAYFICWDTF